MPEHPRISYSVLRARDKRLREDSRLPATPRSTLVAAQRRRSAIPARRRGASRAVARWSARASISAQARSTRLAISRWITGRTERFSFREARFLEELLQSALE